MLQQVSMLLLQHTLTSASTAVRLADLPASVAVNSQGCVLPGVLPAVLW
jgi:hypothetical protein